MYRPGKRLLPKENNLTSAFEWNILLGKGSRRILHLEVFFTRKRKKKRHLILVTHIEKRIKIDIYDTMPKNSIELNAVCSHYKEKYSAGILAEAANNS